MDNKTNVVEITPQSIAAEQEPKTRTRTFRVLKWAGSDQHEQNVWNELAPHRTTYAPSADEVGEQFGEGEFLLIERESDYSFHHVYPMRIVADRVYRLAEDEA